MAQRRKGDRVAAVAVYSAKMKLRSASTFSRCSLINHSNCSSIGSSKKLLTIVLRQRELPQRHCQTSPP